MKITPEMTVKEVLDFNEKMLNAFTWLAPEFERLRYPKLRRAMSGRVSVAQAARIARVPLSEALYLLNLAAGEREEKISAELRLLQSKDFQHKNENSIDKPGELNGVSDTDRRVLFVDVTPEAELKQDPMPKIVRGLVSVLKKEDNILLVRHPFDPIPLRDLFARRFNLTSWAEERRADDWYIYFYRSGAQAAARQPVGSKLFAIAVGA
ncbi:MAG TPA: hypothetical protein VIL74_02425 [Pyrinomonadaceae bacterium]|jgi:hypothetical protein